MTIRPYEEPLLVLAAVLVTLLLVAIYQPRLLLLQTSSGATPAPASASGIASENAAGPDDLDVKHHATDKTPADNTGNTTGNTARDDHPPLRLLCAAEEEISTAGGPRIGVAADREGHFTAYGLPDKRTGLPGKDSYELLRGCVPGAGEGPLFGNQLHLRVDTKQKSPVDLPTGGTVFSAGDAHLDQPTRKAGDTLVTSYRFPGGVGLVQRLTPRKTGVAIGYTVSNDSRTAKAVSLRSLLSPTPASGPDPKVRFKIAGSVAGSGTQPAETDVVFEGPEVPKAIAVPRPAAASSASAVWRPGRQTAPPTRLAIAGYHRLAGPPFDYDATKAYALPENAALAAYWDGMKLGPGESVAVSETYAQPGPRRSFDSSAGGR